MSEKHSLSGAWAAKIGVSRIDAFCGVRRRPGSDKRGGHWRRRTSLLQELRRGRRAGSRLAQGRRRRARVFGGGDVVGRSPAESAWVSAGQRQNRFCWRIFLYPGGADAGPLILFHDCLSRPRHVLLRRRGRRKKDDRYYWRRLPKVTVRFPSEPGKRASSCVRLPIAGGRCRAPPA